MKKSNSKRSHYRAKCRQGTSLIEVIGALVCSSLLLVPTAGVMVDSIRWTEHVEAQNELQHLSDGLMQELSYRIHANFREDSEGGSFRDQGYPKMMYSANWSDRVSGSIPDRLMVIQSVCWYDENENSSLDPAETQVELSTSIARRK